MVRYSSKTFFHFGSELVCEKRDNKWVKNAIYVQNKVDVMLKFIQFRCAQSGIRFVFNTVYSCFALVVGYFFAC